MLQLLADRITFPVLALYLQADESGGGIPWWIWLVLISVLLLLLFIGIARQSGPGEPLPKPDERISAPVMATEEANQEPQPEPAEEVAREPQDEAASE